MEHESTQHAKALAEQAAAAAHLEATETALLEYRFFREMPSDVRRDFTKHMGKERAVAGSLITTERDI